MNSRTKRVNNKKSKSSNKERSQQLIIKIILLQRNE